MGSSPLARAAHGGGAVGTGSLAVGGGTASGGGGASATAPKHLSAHLQSSMYKGKAAKHASIARHGKKGVRAAVSIQRIVR
jgi:hypothetical protein